MIEPFTQCSVDDCVFKRAGLTIALHVDDFTACVESEEVWQKFVTEFRIDFECRDEGRPKQVLGGAVTYGDNGEITWSHSLKVESLIAYAKSVFRRDLYKKLSPGLKGKSLTRTDEILSKADSGRRCLLG